MDDPIKIEDLGPETVWLDGPVESGDFDPPRPSARARVRWKTGLALLGFSLLGTALILPYSLTLMRQSKGMKITPAMEPIIAVVSLLIEGAMSAAAIGIGLGLGRRSGLGPHLLDGLDGVAGSDGAVDAEVPGSPRSRAWKAIGLASGVGVVLGVMVIAASIAIHPWLPDSAKGIDIPAPWEGLLASFGAGIREEVWLRLGLMTFLAWLGALILRRETGHPAAIWTANLLAALAFGAMHLPQAASLIGLNLVVVGFVFVGNGIPGIAFGWLFWRKGLVAAMTAHTLMDVVMKVIYPAFAG